MTAAVRPPPEWLDRLAATAADVAYPIGTTPPPAGGRQAAVLLLFGAAPVDGRADGGVRTDVLLIERARTLRSHAGQPAFPGGMLDPGDDGPVAAALREATEETGLDPSGVRVLASLPPLHVSVSGFVVTPVLAWWEVPSAVAPVDAGEVASVVRVPVDELTDPANRLSIRLPDGRSSLAFRVGGLLVWGMTAALLDGLLTRAGLDRPWDTDRVEELPPDVLELALRSRRKEPR